jgi:DNA polymerase III, alpha subunit
MAESGAPFAHLHVHTEYSMLDGAARLKDLFAEVKNQGMTHVAMTDHGNMYGAAEFHRQAKDAGITPVDRDRGLRRARGQEQHQPGPVGPAAPEEGRRLRGRRLSAQDDLGAEQAGPAQPVQAVLPFLCRGLAGQVAPDG